MKPETEELLHRCLDGHATPEETAALAALLSGNPATADRFAELTRVDESLRVELKAENRAALFTKRLSRIPETAPASVPDRRRWLAAAAALALLGSGTWWLSEAPGPQALGKRWAASKLERKGQDLPEIRTTTGTDRSSDPVAALRRELRGFALPYLHLRDMLLSQALATLNRQWIDLPHAGSTKGKDLPIVLSPQARAAWASVDEEPRVTVDIPDISLHTALQLIAAQAGLKMEITSHTVTLEPDPRMNEPREKTWTFPLAKTQVDAFMVARDPKTDFLKVLERSQFFLKHKSQYPELTVSGGPRVSMFPMELLTPLDVTAAGTAALSGTQITPSPNDGTPSSAEGTVAGKTFNVIMADNKPAGEALYSDNTSPALPVQLSMDFLEKPYAAPPSGSAVPAETTFSFSTLDLAGLGAKPSSDRRTLPGWLGTFGLPGEALHYHPADGVLTVTGGPRTLNTASAAVAALTESAQAGLSMEMRIVSSPDGTPLAFPGGEQGEVDAVDVEQWFKTTKSTLPKPAILQLPSTRSLRDGKISYQVNSGTATVTSNQKRGSEEGQVVLKEIGLPEMKNLQLDARVTASKAGGRWDLTVEVQEKSGSSTRQFSVREGQWMALRLASQNGVLLLRPKAAVLLP